MVGRLIEFNGPTDQKNVIPQWQHNTLIIVFLKLVVGETPWACLGSFHSPDKAFFKFHLRRGEVS